jgi:Ribosomal protein 60S L18 and 50S L18e
MMKKTGRENKTAVVIGTVTDDTRIFEIPKLKVKTYLQVFIPCEHIDFVYIILANPTKLFLTLLVP